VARWLGPGDAMSAVSARAASGPALVIAEVTIAGILPRRLRMAFSEHDVRRFKSN
jgi:hypothetical protein